MKEDDYYYPDDQNDFTQPAGWNAEKVAVFKEHFFEFLNHVQVNSKEKGQIIVGHHVYRAQRRFLDAVWAGLAEDKHDFKVLKSRQLGITTISRALTLFWIGVHAGLRGYMTFDTSPHKEEARLELLGMIRSLPASLGFPKIKRENRDLLELDNGSLMNFASAGVRESKSSGTLGRSSGINFAHNSEMCSWQNTEGIESYKNAMAEDFPDRLYIWESTARGFNQWHDMWEEAKDDTEHQVTIFLGWWAKDNQKIDRGTPDFERYGAQPPSDKERAKIRAVKEQYDWDITPEQLAWIRRKMDPSARAEGDAPAEYEGDVLKVQEQPWCVTRETRVGTDCGLKTIFDASHAKEATLGPIAGWGPTGVARIWRCRTKLGYQFRGTANHPLIDATDNEIRLDKSLGARVRLCPPRLSEGYAQVEWREGPVSSRVVITPDFAKLVGLYMGDGSLQGAGKNGGAGYFCLTCDTKDQDVVEECQRLLKVLFDVDVPTRQQRGWTDVRVGSRLIVDTFRKLNLVRTTPRLMRRVHVPEFIFESPREVVAAFLSGLFEADGFAASDSIRVSFFSKYPDFIQDVQLLLLTFGITSRSVSCAKKGGPDGHDYTGRSLELRKAEAVKFAQEIGFISQRKRARTEGWECRPGRRPPRPVVLEDDVVEVVDEGVEEVVYNITVGGAHWFDANGILTHNTEQDAFQMTGATFFEPSNLTEIANKWASGKFQTYSYVAGLEFTQCTVFKAHNAKSVQLKVWEEPDPEGVYVIAADPAFGSSEDNDRSAIQVLRCYADCVEQVAEYAWPLINTRQFAWVIASLLGWYKECYFILELNGPGEPTLQELQSLKHQLQQGYQPAEVEEKGLRNIFANVKNYMYGRVDSMSAGRNLHWKTTTRLKVAIMERLRDFTTHGKVLVRSMDTLEEMKSITREGDAIEAAGAKKDDRVMAMAMGVRCWEERVRKSMATAQRTREFEIAKKRLTVQDQVMLFQNNQLQYFFDAKAKARKNAALQANRDRWRRGVRR